MDEPPVGDVFLLLKAQVSFEEAKALISKSLRCAADLTRAPVSRKNWAKARKTP